jgi:hypothetical protein
VAAQEIRWNKGSSQPTDDYTFFYGNGNAKYHLGTGVFIHNGFKSKVKRTEFISDKMSYVMVGGLLCDIIFLNVHATLIRRIIFVRN